MYDSRRRTCHGMACRTPVVRISPATTVVGDWVLSPRIASFSSRGPSVEYPAILKVKTCPYVSRIGEYLCNRLLF